MKTKAQMKMFETIGVLIVFFILVAGCLMFFAGTQKSASIEARDAEAQLKAVETAQSAAFMAEIQCSEENIATDNCVELEKAIAIANAINQSGRLKMEHYYDLFGYATISVEKIYPLTGNTTKFVVYDYPKQDSFGKDIYVGKEMFRFPVLVYSSKEGVSPKRYSYGVLEVIAYY